MISHNIRQQLANDLIEENQEEMNLAEHSSDMCRHMLNSVLRKKEYIEFVKNFNEEGGFLWSNNNYINEIVTYTDVDNDGHSGASLACTLRNVQYILKNSQIDMSLYSSSDDDSIEDNKLLSRKIQNQKNDTDCSLCCSSLLNGIVSPPSPPATPGAGKHYILYEQADDYNKEAMDVWAEKGLKAAVEHMTKDIVDGKISYAEMRARYG